MDCKPLAEKAKKYGQKNKALNKLEITIFCRLNYLEQLHYTANKYSHHAGEV